MAERIYLTVPFPEKDSAKQLGARWDAVSKRWYIHDALDQSLFARWLPAAATASIAVAPNKDKIIPSNEPLPTLLYDNESMPPTLDDGFWAMEGFNDGGQALSLTKDPPLGLTLSALMQQVNYVIEEAFSSAIWVKAEVTEVMQRQGHYYLTLTESVNGQQVAQVKANLWASRAPALLAKFLDQTGGSLLAGMNLLLRAEVIVHAKFGLSLTVVDIDPSFTLGDQAAKLNALRQQLIANGLFALNRQFLLPATWTRVAILSPAQAAGLGDFRSDANRLVQHGLCTFEYFHASFQGVNSGAELTAALETIAVAHHQLPFDACVIIRGGGAKQDLMYLNDAVVAQAVCQMPLPVLTGIGHERDSTILDEVAHTRFDTPSKVIAFITERIVLQAQAAQRQWQSIVQQGHSQLSQQRQLQAIYVGQVRSAAMVQVHQHHHKIQREQQAVKQTAQKQVSLQKQAIELHFMRIGMSATQYVTSHKQRLDQHYERVLPAVQMRLSQHRQQLVHWQQLLHAHHPERLLNMGYVMVRDAQARLITSVEDAKTSKHISLQFKDGVVAAQVAELPSKEPRKSEPNTYDIQERLL